MLQTMQSDVIYRSLKAPIEEGILACGFMRKSTQAASQIDFTIDYYSCFLVLSGSGSYSDGNNLRIPLGVGDFVQRLPGVTHTTDIVGDGNWCEFFISFGKPVYDYLCTLEILSPTQPVQKDSALIDDLLITSFFNYLNQLKYVDSSKLPELLFTAQQLILNMRSRQRISIQTPYHQQIMLACERLSTRFQESIDYAKLAKSLNMGYENFRKIFKSTTGISPAKYHTLEKMKQATLMLRSGLTIREVAYLTGYSDIFAFSKQFKKTTGISPGSYV